MELDVVPANETLLHLADRLERNARIQFGVVELNRRFDLCCLVEQVLNAAAVISHRDVDRTLRRRQISKPSAEAIADGRNLARHFGHRAQRLRGRADIRRREVDIGLLQNLDALVAIRAVVAEFDARLRAPEDVGRERHVAVERVLIRDRADMAVHAEDFLNDDDGRPLAGFGQRQIARKVVVAGGDVDPAGSDAHVDLLLNEGRKSGRQCATNRRLLQRPYQAAALGASSETIAPRIAPSFIYIARQVRLAGLAQWTERDKSPRKPRLIAVIFVAANGLSRLRAP